MATLDPTTPIGKVRLLIPDRHPLVLLFEDEDITAFLGMEGDSVKKAAALALESAASSEALISKVIRTQDLTTDGARVSAALLDRAARLREQADNDPEDGGGGLDIIEFVPPHSRYLDRGV